MVPQNKNAGSAASPKKEPGGQTPSSNQNPPKSGSVRPLKTYLTDVQTAIQEQKESLAKIALAERERKEARQKSEPKRREFTPRQRKLFVIGGSVLAILVLAGGAYGAIRFFNIEFNIPGIGEPAIEVRQKITAPSLITAAYEFEVDSSKVSAGDLAALIREERARERNEQSVENIFFTKPRVEAVQGIPLGKEAVSPREFFSMYLTGAPQELMRSLDRTFMVGVYYDQFKIGTPFIVLKVTSFETSLAGMFSWEKTMSNDVGQFLGISSEDTQGFKDVVVQNKDTRSLLNRSREPVLIYSFIDRNTILIAPDKDTFGSVLSLLVLP